MRISSNYTSRADSPLRRGGVQGDGANDGVADLQKSEFLEDIFNNKVHERDHKRSSLVNLSHSAQALVRDLHRAVEKFLQDNKEVAREIEQIPLPEEADLSHLDNVTIFERKINLYVKWSKGDNRGNKGDEPFLSVHKFGKDKEMQKIYEDHERRLMQLRQGQQASAPSYYYKVNPQAYSFN